MDWIETIEVRSYRWPETQKAIARFKQISKAFKEKGVREIQLLQSLAIDNDLNISISWEGDAPTTGKSRLGLQLAAAFAEFGQIHHSGWLNHGSPEK